MRIITICFALNVLITTVCFSQNSSESDCHKKILHTIEKGSEVVVVKKDKTIISGKIVDITLENLILGSLGYSGAKYLDNTENEVLLPIPYNQISTIEASKMYVASKRKNKFRAGLAGGILLGTVVSILDFNNKRKWFDREKEFNFNYVLGGIAVGGIIGLLVKSGKESDKIKLKCD